MLPKIIKIKNWKSIKDEIRININSLNIIIGRNSFGKTNILTAFLFFFNKIKFNEDFICRGESVGEIEVEFDEGSKIRKKFNCEGHLEFEIYSNGNWVKYKNYNGRTKDFKEPICKNIFFIPALKDAKDELTGKTKDNILNHFLESLYSNLDKNSFEEIDKKITDLSSDLNVSEDGLYKNEKVKELKKEFDDELKSWETSIDFNFDLPKIKDIFKMNVKYSFDDGIKTSLEEKGMGFQRNFIFVLMRLAIKKQLDTDSNFILLFEEPEIYLHPQMQRELYFLLKQFSDKGNIIFITTHSGYFVDLQDYKYIIKLDKIENKTSIIQIMEDLFEIEGEEVSRCDKISNLNLTFWLNPERNEMFFADKVILVEGPSEKIAFPYLMRKFIPEEFKFSYSLINCENKDNQVKYIKFLNSYKINYISVYDADGKENFPPIENIIDNKLGSSVVLKEKLEDEIGMSSIANNSNKPFLIFQSVSKNDFVLKEEFKLKLLEIYK